MDIGESGIEGEWVEDCQEVVAEWKYKEIRTGNGGRV